MGWEPLARVMAPTREDDIEVCWNITAAEEQLLKPKEIGDKFTETFGKRASSSRCLHASLTYAY